MSSCKSMLRFTLRQNDKLPTKIRFRRLTETKRFRNTEKPNAIFGFKKSKTTIKSIIGSIAGSSYNPNIRLDEVLTMFTSFCQQILNFVSYLNEKYWVYLKKHLVKKATKNFECSEIMYNFSHWHIALEIIDHLCSLLI